MPLPEHKIKEIMKKSILFKAFDDAELTDFIDRADEKSFERGEIIIREGDKETTMYFILEGEVEVYSEKDGRKVFLDVLRTGDFFGEFSFFTGGVRQATVRALKPTECLVITEELFEEFAERNEEFSKVVVDFYKIRVLDTLLAHTSLFGMLKPQERKEVLACFQLEVVEKGKEIVKEGEEGDALYVIKGGRVEVVTTDPEGREVKLAELGAGDFFGEVALITGRPRTATVRALTKVRLMKLSREDFEEICEKFPEVRLKAEEIVEKRAEDTFSRLLAADRERVKKP